MLRILPILALLGAAAPAVAQDDANPPAAPDLDAALELLAGPEPEQGEEADPYADLGERLSVCLRPLYPDSPPHGDIVLGVEVTADGRPTQPFLIEPPIEAAGIPHLRQLFRAEAALYDCAPLPVADGGDTLRLAASADSLTLASRPGATAGDDEGGIQVELPGVPATAADERALDLARSERREIQVRLRLAGFNPRGADGIFGPNTRSAIADWQAARDLPVSGYLNEVQRDRLIGETEQAYAELRASQSERQGSGRFYRGRDGCLRYRASGQIVPNQNFTCDVKGMFQF